MNMTISTFDRISLSPKGKTKVPGFGTSARFGYQPTIKQCCNGGAKTKAQDSDHGTPQFGKEDHSAYTNDL